MTTGIFRGKAVTPGFSMSVVGVKDVERSFNNLLKGFTPSIRAEQLMPGAEVIAEAARDNILDNELVDSGDLYDSIEPYKINQWVAGVRSRLIYAAVHEYGLENQVITPRQRAFFWAMFKATQKVMWKALALSHTYTIPAQPYLRPAVDSHKNKAVRAIMRSVSSYMTKRARLRGH